MTGALPLSIVLVATAVSAVIIFLERLFPFALFGKREPPAIIRFIEKYIPSMIMAILIVYSLKDTGVTERPFGIPSALAIAATVILHRLFRNSMVSIFGATALYIVLSRLM